tara:strand:- start:203 stop:484 length:282 start_codon:yes stop_codon:yes gene_type:complete
MSYTDDMYQDTQYDQFDPDEDDFQQRHYNEGYETELGVQARLMEEMIEPDKLMESEYTIDEETGLVREKTEVEKFMRDYGIYLGIFLLVGIMT